MKKIYLFLFSLFICNILATQNQNYKIVRGISYTQSKNPYAVERCKLDLYYPENAKNFPTIAWFHGGGLSGGSKFIPEESKNRGLAVIVVNYRLLPKVTLSDCIDDAAAVVAWTLSEIKKYGGDRCKIFVSGHSAGGYLTNVVGLDKRWLTKYRIDANSIAALIPFSGHAISHFAYRQVKGMKDTQSSIDEFAPLFYVHPGAPPLIIVSGNREMEMLGCYEEDAYFWRMMKVAGHKSTYIYELDGYDHGSMAAPAFHISENHVKAILKGSETRQSDKLFNLIRMVLFSLLMVLIYLNACSGAKTSDNATVYVTTNDHAKDFVRSEVALGDKQAASPSVITIDPLVHYQTMDGFGAAVTGSTCYNLMQMVPGDRTAFLRETFSDMGGVGYSYIRISIGCSDFSSSEYTCCDTKGVENSALQSEEKEYVISILKEILAISPSIKILGSPWTCPRRMKVDNLKDLRPFEPWTNGRSNPAYYQDYATYFVKWIQVTEAEGIPIETITPQNEPLNRGSSASLFMGWEEQPSFVCDTLGPKLKETGLKMKIYAFDYNYNYDNMLEQQGYPMKIYENENAVSFPTGAAYHNYGGDREELNNVNDKFPDKELIFTETSTGMWNDGRNLEKRLMEDMEETALGTMNNWCKAVIVWDLMLDNRREPDREGSYQTCYGAVDTDRSDYKAIIRNSRYYTIGRLSSVVKPGTVRIGSKGYTTDGIMYSAFENLGGTKVLVLLNNTDGTKNMTVSSGECSFTYEIPAKAVASFRQNLY